MGPLPAQKLIPVRSEALQPGLYVAELDRSWLHSSFPATGFLITSGTQVEQLRRLCRYVYVDPAQSEISLDSQGGEPTREPAPGRPAPAASAGTATPAGHMLGQVLHALAGIVCGARRQGIVDFDAVERCAGEIVSHVTHDADALHFCLRVDARGSLLYRRAVGTAAVAVTLGRHLGLDRDTLLALASGGLLLDLGKIAVPVPILAKPGALGTEEQGYVRRHVERSLELVAGHDLSAAALEMIGSHHEYIDGSGYPHRLAGTHIPLFGRLAAIADAFDAMTLDRRYAAAISPHAALRQLDGLRDRKFDAALVMHLGEALGHFPVGTLVEMLDGRVGLVCSLRGPHQVRIILTHDHLRQPLAEPVLLHAAGTTDIARPLPPRAVQVDALGLEPLLKNIRQTA